MMNKIEQQIDLFKQDPFQFMENSDIKQLVEMASYLNKEYYNNQSIIKDDLYDILIDYLRNKDPKNKFLKIIEKTVKRKKIQLPYFMGSMDKLKTCNEIQLWKNKNINDYHIYSDKLDGVSALLMYENKNIYLYKRGDGKIGSDISQLIKYLQLPNYNQINQKLVIRGELIISKQNFKKYNKIFSDARNMISGITNSKDIDINMIKDVDFVAYECIEPWNTFEEQIKTINKYKLNVVYNDKIKYNDINIQKLTEIIIDRKQNSKYYIDGIIIFNSLYIDKRYTQKDRNPKYAFAFKNTELNESKQTTVIDIKWNISKDNYIKPTIILQPIIIENIEIKATTGNNAKYIYDNNIGIGTIVEIIRSGDVIPKIINIIKASDEPLMPNQNIIKWKWNKSKVDIIASKNNSIQNKVKKIIHFCKTLDIKYLDEKTIEKLIQNGIDNINKLLNIQIKDLEKLDNFGQKMANKIYNEIQNALLNTDISTFIAATNSLGRGIGIKKIQKIFEYIPNIINEYINGNKQYIYKKLLEIDGFDTLTSNKIIKNFYKFLDILPYLSLNLTKQLLYFKKEQKEINQKINKFKIVFSGFRNKNLENQIIKQGGIIQNSVSQNTDILITNDKNSTSNKIQTAKQLKIKILNENEFIQQYLE